MKSTPSLPQSCSMQCAICEKPIYGHPEPAKGRSVVCGSCTLTKMNSASPKASKDLYQVRSDLAKLKSDAIRHEDFSMAVAVVCSNYARNRTVLLDGKYPLTFDAQGKAHCPTHLAEALEREMDSRPGRYWYAEAVATVIPVSPPPPVVESPVVAKVEEKIEEVPAQISLSFEDDSSKKAPSKGKQKK